jgi:hypothetical protein
MVEQSKEDLEKFKKNMEQFAEFKTNFYTQIMIPRFIGEVNKDLQKALRYYKSMLELEDTPITNHLFDIINTNIFYVGGLDRQNSKDILRLGIERSYIKTPRQRVLTYYLLLSALILDNQSHNEEYEKYLRDFKTYIKENEGISFKNSLKKFFKTDTDISLNLSEENVNSLEAVISIVP